MACYVAVAVAVAVAQVENINLPPTLLSRFDLIYLVLDKVDQVTC